MSGTTLLGQAGLRYLSEVAAALGELDSTERGELLDEVREHLVSISSEVAPAELRRDLLLARLGPPSRYAAELAGAAGLSTLVPLGTRDASASLWQTAQRHKILIPIWSYLRSLLPAWWALRGYLIAGLLVQSFGSFPGTGNIGRREFMHWKSDIFSFGLGTSWVRLWFVVPIGAAVVASIVVGVHGERASITARLQNRALDAVALLGLVAAPMWWIGPEFYAFVLQR